jgi:hypothetical protein
MPYENSRSQAAVAGFVADHESRLIRLPKEQILAEWRLATGGFDPPASKTVASLINEILQAEIQLAG